MKKWLKITLISLGSLLGLLLIAVCVACWLIFTPARLTSIVNSLTAKYINAETHFDKVDLTLFKTFPDVGVDIHDFYVVNPMVGAPSDTLAYVSSLAVGVNLREFLGSGNIIVRKLCLDNTKANIFIDDKGANNFSIFPQSSDTTSSAPFSLPDDIDISHVSVKDFNCIFIDEQHGMNAQIDNLSLAISAALRNTLSGKADIDVSVDSIAFAMDGDSTSQPLNAALKQLSLKADMVGDTHKADGRLRLTLPKAQVAMGEQCFINEALSNSSHDLLSLDLPFSLSMSEGSVTLQDSRIGLDQLLLSLSGHASLASDHQPMQLTADFSTNEIVVQNLLPYIPEAYAAMLNGISVKAAVHLDGHAEGIVAGDTLPVVSCNVRLSDGQFAYQSLPVRLQKIAADLSARLDLSKATPSDVQINKLCASYKDNDITIRGRVDDLMNDMRIDATADGDLVLAELMPLLPEDLPVHATGSGHLSLKAAAKMSQITKMDLQHIKLDGAMSFSNLDATYDSIHVDAPDLKLNLSLPSNKSRLPRAELAEARIVSSKLNINMPASKTSATLHDADIALGISNILDKKQPIEAAVNLKMDRTDARVDSINVLVEDLRMKGTVNYDSLRSNILYQLDPTLNVSFARTAVLMPSMPEAVRLSSFQFDYRPNHCQIADADIHWGLSDYHISGTVRNLEEWIDHNKPLDADINFTSDYTDVDQIMALISGMGSNADTLEAMRKEDKVDSEANPFIVPLDMNVDLHTHVKRCVALGNDLSDLAGNISIRDGKAILDQVGFVCRAARMQLTGIYKSPRPNHLYLGVDFHLLDIQIGELVEMIPYVDTLIPMITAFDGQANFHLALETYLDAHYSPKTSTLLGSSAISGKELVVLPGETFDMIAKYLMFNKKTVNKIDSLDVELTLFRNRIDVYPFLLSMDKYQVCVSGVHSLDNACNYHLELLKSPLPLRLAVDVTGHLPKPHVALGKVKYNDLYNPQKTDAIKTRTLEIKKMVRDALESNVR